MWNAQPRRDLGAGLGDREGFGFPVELVKNWRGVSHVDARSGGKPNERSLEARGKLAFGFSLIVFLELSLRSIVRMKIVH